MDSTLRPGELRQTLIELRIEHRDLDEAISHLAQAPTEDELVAARAAAISARPNTVASSSAACKSGS